MNRRTFASLLLAGCVVVLGASSPARAADGKKLCVACVGDSITFGSGVENRESNAYPAVLQRLLGDPYEVKNFGVSGATLLKNGDKPYWNQKAFDQAKALEPDIVIIKLGTNDSKPQNWKHRDEFAADAAAMVDAFASLPSKPKVYVCTPVPAYPGNFGIDDTRIREGVILIWEKVAKEKNAPVIDLYAALSGKPELFPDKVHPNAAGAKLMAETIYKAVAGK
jgi:acyl-CoA thioesterase-1